MRSEVKWSLKQKQNKIKKIEKVAEEIKQKLQPIDRDMKTKRKPPKLEEEET